MDRRLSLPILPLMTSARSEPAGEARTSLSDDPSGPDSDLDIKSVGSTTRRSSVFDLLYEKKYQRRVSIPESELWRPPKMEEAEEKEKKEKPRTARNSIDANSIYTIKRAMLVSRGMELPPKPNTPKDSDLAPLDVDNKREKEYIGQTGLPDCTQDNFSKMIMQTFYKAPRPARPSKSSQRELSKDSTQHMLVSGLQRKPSVVRVATHLSLCQAPRGAAHEGLGGEYCDILGPGCCSSCIENSNRSIAEEIQRRLFPSIEVSRNSLVVPKLARTLRDGHLRQLRRRRLHELNLEEPHLFRTRERPLDSKKYRRFHKFPKVPPKGKLAPTFETLSEG